VKVNLKLYALRNEAALTTHAAANYTRGELATALRKARAAAGHPCSTGALKTPLCNAAARAPAPLAAPRTRHARTCVHHAARCALCCRSGPPGTPAGACVRSQP
jgi:hypothetical protein